MSGPDIESGGNTNKGSGPILKVRLGSWELQVLDHLHPKRDQARSGEAIGILILDQSSPFIPANVACSTIHDFPVRFRGIPSFFVACAIEQDPLTI